MPGNNFILAGLLYANGFIVMTRRTFAELYCEKHGIPMERYGRSVFNRTLYAHARLLAWLINLVHREYFAPDRDFVEDVGRLRAYHDFIGSGLDFSHHPENRGFLRSVLRVRHASSRRTRWPRRSTAPS